MTFSSLSLDVVKYLLPPGAQQAAGIAGKRRVFGTSAEQDNERPPGNFGSNSVHANCV